MNRQIDERLKAEQKLRDEEKKLGEVRNRQQKHILKQINKSKNDKRLSRCRLIGKGQF